MKKIGLIIGLLAVVLFTSITTLYSQVAPPCEQVNVIDTNLGSKLSFFKSYQGFQQAVLEQADNGYHFTVYFKKDNVFQIERLPVTEQELREICSEIDRKQEVHGEDPSQEARRKFLMSTTTYSLGFYGWAVPNMFEHPSTKAYIASYLLIGAGGFFVPFLATNNRDITDGMSRAYTMGTLLGISHGVGFYELFTNKSFYSDVDVTDPATGEVIGTTSISNLKPMLISTVLTSLVEGWGLFALAKYKDYTWGQMSSIGSGGLHGSFYGNLLSGIIFEEPKPVVLGASSLLLSAGGMFTGNYLYHKRNVTHGDVTVINSYSTLVMGYGLSAVESFQPDNFRPYATSVLVGSVAGIGLGLYRTHDYHYTRFQSNMMVLGEVTGGLVGLGVVVLAESEKFSSHLWAVTIGATAGLVSTDFIVRSMQPSSKASASNLNIQFNPYGLLGAFKSDNHTYQPNDYRYQNSLLQLNYSF